MEHKIKVFLHFFSLHLLLIGAINWGILGLTGYNVISRVSKLVNLYDFSYILYIMIGLAALIFIWFFYSDSIHLKEITSEATLPAHVLSLTSPLDYDHEVSVKAPKDAKYAIYWTTRPLKNRNLMRKDGDGDGDRSDEAEVDDEATAYGDYSNSGVVEVKNGVAVMKFKSPRPYKNRIGTVSEPSLNYKWLSSDNGLSGVQSTKI